MDVEVLVLSVSGFFCSNFFTLVGQLFSHSLVMFFLGLPHESDTESAKGSRRQLKDAIYSSLFDMNVPAVCAVNQV